MGILAGDTRIHKHYVLQVLLEAGFILCEGVVKIQHKMNTTRKKWLRLNKRNFLPIYHERLYILGKPIDSSGYEKYKYSSRIEL